MKHENVFNEFLKSKVNLNQSRVDTLDQKVKVITNLLKDKLDNFSKYSLQGSYAHKTIIKPVKQNHEFDADILVFIKDNYFNPSSFTDYVKQIHEIFKNDGNYSDKIKLNTRCLTINYAGNFHLDIIPCIEYNDKHYICNRTNEEYEITDGDGYKTWLDGKNRTVAGNNFRKATRLFKFLRDHKGNFSVKSILLTTLLGNQVDDYSDYSDLPTTLKTLSNKVNDFLQLNSSMPIIKNPVLRNENFNRHWDESRYQNFKDKFAIYNKKINDAFDETNRDESIKKWRELFGDDLGTLNNNNNKATVGVGASLLSSGVAATKPYAGDDFLQF